MLATLKFPLIYLFRSCKFKIAASFLGSTPINTHESADSILEIKGSSKDKSASSNIDGQNNSVNTETIASNDEEE